MKKTSVSINVLNYNTYEKSKKCIESALAQVGLDYIVLLVDNCSTDGSFERLRDDFGNRIEYLQNPENYGFARGNNLGVLYCYEHGISYSLLLNSDTEIIGENFLRNITSVLSSVDKCAVVAPKILTVTHNGLIHQPNDSGYLKMLRFVGVLPYNKKINKRTKTLSSAHGSALLVDNNAFLKVGGFPEHYFMYYEELTFSKRIIWDKRIIVSYEDAGNYVLHHHDKTNGTDPWRTYLMGRNGSLEYWENRKNHTSRWYLVYCCAIIKAWCVGVIKGERFFFDGIIAGLQLYKTGATHKDCYMKAKEIKDAMTI